jgi:hypothetical protein
LRRSREGAVSDCDVPERRRRDTADPERKDTTVDLIRTRRVVVVAATAAACLLGSAGGGIAAESAGADRASAKRVILDRAGDQERTPDAPDTATFDDAQVFGDLRKVVVRRAADRVAFTYTVGDVLAADEPGAAEQYFDSIFATEHRTLDTFLSTRITRSSGRLKVKTALKTHAGVIDHPRRTCAVRHVVRPGRHQLTVSLKRSCLGTPKKVKVTATAVRYTDNGGALVDSLSKGDPRGTTYTKSLKAS